MKTTKSNNADFMDFLRIIVPEFLQSIMNHNASLKVPLGDREAEAIAETLINERYLSPDSQICGLGFVLARMIAPFVTGKTKSVFVNAAWNILHR